jgi:hypothetical protein
LPAFVILCREILVSGLREFLREVNVGLPVTKLAKWKTAFQMTALSMMLFRDLWIGWSYCGELLLWVAAVLTFITGYQYYQRSLAYVRAEEAQKVVSEKVIVEVAEEVAPVKKVEQKKKTMVSKSKATAKTSSKKKTAAKKTKTAAKTVGKKTKKA